MSKKNRNKRKDPMKGLIIVTVLLVILTVAAAIGSMNLKNYREGILTEKQQQAALRNQEKQAQYNAELRQYQAEVSSNQANKAWPAAKSEGWDVIDLTNYPLEAPGTVNVERSSILNNGLLLVNEWHSRPEDFDDSGVVSLATYARQSGLDSFWENGSVKLFPVAVDALVAALTDAKAAGYEHFVVSAENSYRSWENQNERFQKQVEYYRNRYPNNTEEQLIERAKKYVNYPGTSEFNTGLGFGLYLYASGNEYYKDTPFYQTEEGKWFYENSWKYGLVFRFPTVGYPTADTADKTYKTGMSQSLNCYRYVGKGHAAVMHHLDLCLEEYIEFLQEHPHIAVFENGVKKYEITRQQVGDDQPSFTVEINRMTGNYTMSLDNMGGVITVYEY